MRGEREFAAEGKGTERSWGGGVVRHDEGLWRRGGVGEGASYKDEGTKLSKLATMLFSFPPIPA